LSIRSRPSISEESTDFCYAGYGKIARIPTMAKDVKTPIRIKVSDKERLSRNERTEFIRNLLFYFQKSNKFGFFIYGRRIKYLQCVGSMNAPTDAAEARDGEAGDL